MSQSVTLAIEVTSLSSGSVWSLSLSIVISHVHRDYNYWGLFRLL